MNKIQPQKDAASQRLADTPEEMARQLLDDAAGELNDALAGLENTTTGLEAARAFIEQAQELLAAAGRN